MAEKVDGIDAGADDYLIKPFRMEELLARIRAVTPAVMGHASPLLTHGALEVDTRQRSIALAGRPVTVTPLEYRLIAYLVHHRGRVISQTELSEHVYDQEIERDLQLHRGSRVPHPRASSGQTSSKPDAATATSSAPRDPADDIHPPSAARHRSGRALAGLRSMGFALVVAFDRAVRAHAYAELEDRLDGLVRSFRIEPDGSMRLVREPGDPRFQKVSGGSTGRSAREPRSSSHRGRSPTRLCHGPLSRRGLARGACR